MPQTTLSGETVSTPYTRPSTLLLCGTCGETVLVSQADSHPHPVTEPSVEQETGLPEDCLLDTQGYVVQYHMEVVEVVRVPEATDKWDAKEIAGHMRDFRGEYMDDIHTTTREVGEPSQASEDYLKMVGLLPDDTDEKE